MLELLAPAGNLEKLKIAFDYGADAVYLGYKEFSLRNLTHNFTIEELKIAKEIAEKKDKKIYITVNIYPYPEDIENLYNFIEQLKDIEPHAVIVSDPGIINIFKKNYSSVKIHLSTQANTTNYESINFWEKIGISRVNLARELSLNDIKIIRKNCPNIELEVFIHGAMCMSMSGRCLLSNYLTSRPSNKGECTHPCRWKYYIVEETRLNQFMEIIEDSRGSYIFNSKDLCGIFFLKDLIEMNIDSIKIEGRMKSLYYVANVVRVYRDAINTYYENPEKFNIKSIWLEELNNVSHREYCKGFFEKRNFVNLQKIDSSAYIRNYDFIGIIKKVKNNNLFLIEARNKIKLGDKIEIITKEMKNFEFTINELHDINLNSINFVNPNQFFYIKIDEKINISKNSLLRKKRRS